MRDSLIFIRNVTIYVMGVALLVYGLAWSALEPIR